MVDGSDKHQAPPTAVQNYPPILEYQSPGNEFRGPTVWDIFKGLITACFSLGFLVGAIIVLYVGWDWGNSVPCLLAGGIMSLILFYVFGRIAIELIRDGIKVFR